jgi:hypothetical protein
MLRRVTALAALGGESAFAASEEAGSIHRRLGIPFTEVIRRRHARTSACAIVGLSWDFHPPAAGRQSDRPVPSDYTTSH